MIFLKNAYEFLLANRGWEIPLAIALIDAIIAINPKAASNGLIHWALIKLHAIDAPQA